MLAAAEANVRAQGLGNVTVQRGDAEDPLFQAGQFDVILAGYVIQFLPHPAQAVRRWRALLAPGGTVGFSWGLAQDQRWEAVMAAVDAHLPAGITGFDTFLRRPPFDGTGPAGHLLTGNGFGAVNTVTHAVEAVYHGPEQWWAACQSQAPWAISWRHIPPVQVPAAQADAFRQLKQIEEPGGTYTRRLTFACTAGTVAGTP